MNGVNICGYHSFKDLGLILKSYDISPPAYKEYSVDVEGANGSLDFTEAFGLVNYSNRTLKFSFVNQKFGADILETVSKISDAIQGVKGRIMLEDDPLYYYVGRVNIDSHKISETLGQFEISVNAEPFKYKKLETCVTYDIVSSKEVLLHNSRMETKPYFRASSSFTVKLNERYEVELEPSEDYVYFEELLLNAGLNRLAVTGTGTLSIKYQEGRL